MLLHSATIEQSSLFQPTRIVVVPRASITTYYYYYERSSSRSSLFQPRSPLFQPSCARSSLFQPQSLLRTFTFRGIVDRASLYLLLRPTFGQGSSALCSNLAALEALCSNRKAYYASEAPTYGLS